MAKLNSDTHRWLIDTIDRFQISDSYATLSVLRAFIIRSLRP